MSKPTDLQLMLGSRAPKQSNYVMCDVALLEIAAAFLRAKSETAGMYRRRYKGELRKAEEIADLLLPQNGAHNV